MFNGKFVSLVTTFDDIAPHHHHLIMRHIFIDLINLAFTVMD